MKILSLCFVLFCSIAHASEDLLEVQHQGKTFKEWLELAEDPEGPLLMDIYVGMDASLEEKMLPAVEFILKSDSKQSKKFDALQVLTGYRHHTRGAIELFLKAAKDPDPAFQKEVMSFLNYLLAKPEAGEYKDAILELYLPKLEDPDAEIRRSALDGIGSLRANGVSAITKVIEVLKKDPDAHVRFCAASTLEFIGRDRKEVVGPLIEALQKDPDADVRYRAVSSLWSIRAGEAGPAFKEAAEKDPDGQVRAFAKEFAERMMELHELQKQTEN